MTRRRRATAKAVQTSAQYCIPPRHVLYLDVRRQAGGLQVWS